MVVVHDAPSATTVPQSRIWSASLEDYLALVGKVAAEGHMDALTMLSRMVCEIAVSSSRPTGR